MFPSYNQVLRLQQSALEHQAALKFLGSLCDYHHHCNPHWEISKSLPARFLKHSAHCTDISQAGPSSSLILSTTLATSVYTCPSFNTGIMSVSPGIFIVHLMVLHGVHPPPHSLSKLLHPRGPTFKWDAPETLGLKFQSALSPEDSFIPSLPSTQHPFPSSAVCRTALPYPAHGLAVTDSHSQSSHTSSGPQDQVRPSQLGLNLVLSLRALYLFSGTLRVCHPMAVMRLLLQTL